MDLSASYLGLKLRTPLVPSASPLSQDIDNVRRLEDAGASAVVLYSLFEERLYPASLTLKRDRSSGTESFIETSANGNPSSQSLFSPEGYLDHIRKAKRAVQIPLIASLNASSLGHWTQWAKQIQEAGADAIECNIYNIPTDMNKTAAQVEAVYLEVLETLKSALTIPVAFKLSPYFSNMAHMAKKLDGAGLGGLVLFNRFYQPDIDLENLTVRPSVLLSTAEASRLPLTWIGILYGRVKASLAATSGIHEPEDVVKMLMVGASVTMLCSVLLRKGIGHLSTIERGLAEWMKKHGYDSVGQMQGKLSQVNCSDPSAFERAQYVHAIQSYRHLLVDGETAWSLLSGEND